MLTLEQLALIKKLPKLQLEKRNVFYFPKLTEPSTHFIESLFFRLENVEEQSIIVLGDRRIVKPIDIKTGLFIPSDLGEMRSDIIAKRFTGLGKTKLVSLANNDITDANLISSNTNLFIFSFGESYESEIGYIQSAMKQKQDADSLKTYLFRVGINKGDISIRLNEIQKLKVIGDVEPIRTARETVNTQSKFVRFSLASQLLFNMVNNILTPDLDINYTGIDFTVNDMKTELGHLFGLDDSSIFAKIEGKNNNLDIATLNRISKLFDKYKEVNKQRFDMMFRHNAQHLHSTQETINLPLYAILEGVQTMQIAHTRMQNEELTLEQIREIFEADNLFLPQGFSQYNTNKVQMENLLNYLQDYKDNNVTVYDNSIETTKDLYILKEFVENQYMY